MNPTRRDMIAGIAASVCCQCGASAHTEPQGTVICNFRSKAKNILGENFGSVPRAGQSALNFIFDSIGIEPDIEFLMADFHHGSPIAYAWYKPSGFTFKRRIVMDRAYFSWDEGRLGWHEFGVLGHEVGHLISGHGFRRHVTSHDQELEADQFAGFIAGRLGATAEQSVAWTNLLTSEGSTRHPKRSKRKAASLVGWKLAQD